MGTIGYDKINQLRHVRFLKDAEGLAAHMSKHAAILRPKFELVLTKLDEGLSEVGGCSWSHPRGGYFVSFDAPEGTAKRIVQLAKEAGVTMTGAGATWPYKHDPHDSNIRIAPTLPPLDELDAAMDVFVCCTKLAYTEKLRKADAPARGRRRRKARRAAPARVLHVAAVLQPFPCPSRQRARLSRILALRGIDRRRAPSGRCSAAPALASRNACRHSRIPRIMLAILIGCADSFDHLILDVTCSRAHGFRGTGCCQC